MPVKLTAAPVDALSPADGDHAYVVAPDAVIDVDDPEHTEADTGVTVTTGVTLTVIALVAEAVQPAALVPVTVYVVVAAA